MNTEDKNQNKPTISTAGALRLFAVLLEREMKENAALRAKIDKLNIANIRRLSRVGGGV